MLGTSIGPAHRRDDSTLCAKGLMPIMREPLRQPRGGPCSVNVVQRFHEILLRWMRGRRAGLSPVHSSDHANAVSFDLPRLLLKGNRGRNTQGVILPGGRDTSKTSGKP